MPLDLRWFFWQEEKHNTGKSETIPIELVSDKIVQLAVKVSNLIGNGLYGVDIKQSGNELFVIEVNDNPSMDAGIEDKVLKQHLYLTIASCCGPSMFRNSI